MIQSNKLLRYATSGGTWDSKMLIQKDSYNLHSERLEKQELPGSLLVVPEKELKQLKVNEVQSASIIPSFLLINVLFFLK